MGWREVRDNAPFERLEENMADQIADYMKLSGVSLREHVDLGAALALMTWLFDRPPADRIAMARELLAGTRWVVVPEEPTLEMLQDGHHAARKVRGGGVCGMTIDSQTRVECAREGAAWRAMVATAREHTP